MRYIYIHKISQAVLALKKSSWITINQPGLSGFSVNGRDPMAGPYGGTLWWDPMVGLYGGTLWWDPFGIIYIQFPKQCLH